MSAFDHETEDRMWMAMVIWEHFLECHAVADKYEVAKDNPMLNLWNNIGTNSMRQIAIDVVPWVDAVFRRLEEILGDEALSQLGLDAYDWDYVPFVLSFATWTDDIHTPDVEETAAKIIAIKAHDIRAA